MIRRWLSDPKRRWGTIALLIVLWIGNSKYQARFTPVEATAVRRGDLMLRIPVSGEVEGDAADLSFDNSGKVIALYAEEGQAIEEGQALARIEINLAMGQTYGSVDVIEAPYDGHVVKIDQRVGTVVQQSQPVMRVVRRGSVWVTAFVDAEDAAYIQSGDRFTCRAGGYLARPWDLEVVTVGREAVPRDQLIGSANQIRLRLRPLQGDFALPIGSEVDVDGEVSIARDRLIIPAAAIVREDGESLVWVVDGQRALRQPVVTGPNNFRELVVDEGLRAGQRIIVAGKDLVDEDSLLRVSEWDDGS